LKEKAEFLNSRTGKQSLQPHVIAIAEGDLKDAVVYAVVGEQLYYTVNSVMEAVDTVIKLCFVLDLDYPLPARSSWTFVQQAVYSIATKYDVASTRVKELLSSVQ